MSEPEVISDEVSDARREEWRHSLKYLPDFMRDFHDQKRLFKAIDEVVQRAKEEDEAEGRLTYHDVNWVSAQVYVIDIFLWVMAGHGYTLQKQRSSKFRFKDIYDFIEDSTKRWRAASASILFGKKKDTGDA